MNLHKYIIVNINPCDRKKYSALLLALALANQDSKIYSEFLIDVLLECLGKRDTHILHDVQPRRAYANNVDHVCPR